MQLLGTKQYGDIRTYFYQLGCKSITRQVGHCHICNDHIKSIRCFSKNFKDSLAICIRSDVIPQTLKHPFFNYNNIFFIIHKKAFPRPSGKPKRAE